MVQFSTSATSFTPSWQTVKAGAGGEMNNIAVSGDGNVIVAAQNTYGAYIYKTSGNCDGAANGGWGSTYASPCWEQLFTQTSAPLTLAQVANLQQGVNQVEVCNSNSNDGYAYYDRALWFTTNLKASAVFRTWTKNGPTTAESGNTGKPSWKTIACDPNNPQVVYVSAPAAVKASGNGLNAGATFNTVTGIGTIGSVPDVFAFDGSSGATTQACSQFSGSPTCTAHLWIFVAGTGMYESYNGGSSFTLTSGGPSVPGVSCESGPCFTLKADQFGKVWASVGDSKLYLYTPNGSAGGGTWSNKTPVIVNPNVGAFALDPTSGSAGTLRIAASYADGNISISTNGGTGWCTAGFQAWTTGAAQPAWFANANQNQGATGTYYAAKDISFDASGNLWLAGGIGMFEILSANVGCGVNWQVNTLGIESVVASHIDGPPGNAAIAAAWDRAFWSFQNPDVFPAHHWIDFSFGTTNTGVQGGWGLDWASTTPNTLSGWAGNDGPFGGSSSNGGNTWTKWASFGAAVINVGGELAASTPTNWLWIPANTSGQLFFTTNGATSWTASTAAGSTTPFSANQQHGFHIAADRVTANTFCLIDNNYNILASTNSGSSFSVVNSTTLVNQYIKYNDALKAVPGQAGVFYFSGGNAGGGSTTFNLWKITKVTNECDTATKVNANITNIFGFGYGAPLPGGNGFPTIYFYGAVSGVVGLYEIDNGGTTAALIAAPAAAQTWPNNSGDFINDVSGDMNFYGRVYVGHNGSGFAYIDHQNACPSAEFSNVNPNASLTGTITLSASHSGLVPVSSVSFYVDNSLIGTQTVGSGTPPTYSQSWNASGVAPGAHTITVTTNGNGCTVAKQPYNSFTIPVTTS